MPSQTDRSEDSRIWNKICRYCSSQERSIQQVYGKLAQWGVSPERARRYVDLLQQEGWLNENRFAAAYAGGKLRQKGWGPAKILYRLRQMGVAAEATEQALSALDADECAQVLRREALKKSRTLKGTKLQRIQKLTQFLMRRGFDPHQVSRMVHEIIQ